MSDTGAERRSHANLDVRLREQKAARIAGLLQEFSGPLSGLRLLDIGSGSGVIASYFARLGARVVTVDVTDERVVRDCPFHLVESEWLPFPNRSFDVVLSNHVVEHVDNPARHLAEIRRVLAHAGACYLATPNRFRLVEPHYRLPLLSLLPRPLADGYVRLARRGTAFDVHPLSYRRLDALARRAGFAVTYCSPQIAADTLRLPRALVPSALVPILPSLNVLLTGGREER